MRPARPGPTRTAPPRGPAGYPLGRPRYRSYVLYAATSVLFLLEGLILLRGAWALGSGPQAWSAYADSLAQPAYLVWHAFVLAVTVWFGSRTFFKLFAKTQPPVLPLPPLELIPPAMGALWAGVTLALVAFLFGVLP
jgi:fumarate reductase subunit C